MRPIILQHCFFTAQDFVQHLMTLGSKGALTGQLMALLIHRYQRSLSVSGEKAELRGDKNS
jgi:hypothetical protein